MYQDATSKWWYPATITSLCREKRSYLITTSDGLEYRKMQSHLKPYTPQGKKLQSTQCVSQLMAQSDHMWLVKQSMAQKSLQVSNQLQVHTSRPKRDTKPPVKPDL